MIQQRSLNRKHSLLALENEEAMESISQSRSCTEGDGQSKQMRDDNVNSKESGCNAEKSMPIHRQAALFHPNESTKHPWAD